MNYDEASPQPFGSPGMCRGEAKVWGLRHALTTQDLTAGRPRRGSSDRWHRRPRWGVMAPRIFQEAAGVRGVRWDDGERGPRGVGHGLARQRGGLARRL